MNKWIPTLRRLTRLWSAVVIALGLFIFIAHIFETPEVPLDPYPWWENLMPISLMIAIGGLAVSWRWEAIGGVITLVFCLVNVLLYLATGREQVGAVMLITLPVFLPGLLFLLYARATSRPD
jgi:hypothetical protein